MLDLCFTCAEASISSTTVMCTVVSASMVLTIWVRHSGVLRFFTGHLHLLLQELGRMLHRILLLSTLDPFSNIKKWSGSSD